MTDRQKLQRHMTTAQRELRHAVDRAAGVDLRPGHVAEARRRAQAVVDAANELVAALEKAGPKPRA